MLRRFCQQVAEVVRRLRRQLKFNPLGSLSILVVFLLLCWIIWETTRLDNMGFESKSFWDWMELLVIPVVLAIGAFLFNRSERKAEQRIAAERFQEKVLQNYLDRMTELLLDRQLLASEDNSEARVVAEAQTFTVLRVLDAKRRGVVLKFLYDAELIAPKDEAVVFLEKADLRGADLCGADLYEAHLSEADLSGADLKEALLYDSYLIETDLRGADLRETDLRGADLRGADLSDADLREALLERADLLDADLSRADLRDAIILDGTQLRRARSLKDATLPNGRVYRE